MDRIKFNSINERKEYRYYPVNLEQNQELFLQQVNPPR